MTADDTFEIGPRWDDLEDAGGEFAGAYLWPHSIEKRLGRARNRLGVLPLDQLRGLPLVEDSTRWGVYFLWIGPTLVYIGQSIDIPRRLEQHAKGWKTWGRATYLLVAPEALKWFEKPYVQQYRPRFNLTSVG